MRNYPIIKVTILFVVGIISSQIFQISFMIPILLFVLLLIILIIFYFFKQKPPETITSVLIVLLIFSLANHYASVSAIKENKFFSSINAEKDFQVYGSVKQIDLLKDDLFQFYIISDSIKSKNFFVKDKITFLCRMYVTDQFSMMRLDSLSPGNFVLVKGEYRQGKERRNPGEFDYNEYLKSIGVTGIISVYSEENIVILNNQADVFNNFVYHTRKFIYNQITRLHTPQTASLLTGLLLADRRGIDYETRVQFINAGVIHVLAVSGLHVGYIVLIFALIFGRFNIFVRSILTVIGLLLFMIITGGPPSVIRASVMAIVIIAAFVSGRSTNLFNSLAIAALIILLFDSNEIFSAGFQLSFSAVLSIAIIYPITEKKISEFSIPKYFKVILLFIAVSLSAQIGTIPFTLLYFNKLSVIALFTNLLVIPLIGIIISIGIVTIASGFITTIAVFFAAANEFFADMLFRIVNFSGSLEFSHFSIYQFGWVDLLFFYIFLTIFIYFNPYFRRPVSKILLILFSAANIYFYTSLTDINLLPDNELSVMMIDVGQGDSFLVKFPDGKTALIDAGMTTYFFDNGERVILPLLNLLDVKRIDYGFISHLDLDHYGGFVELILDGKIKNVYKPPFDSASVQDSLFESFCKKQDVKINYYKTEIIKEGNVRIYSLYNRNLIGETDPTGNDNSGLLKIVYGNTSILFTGDLERKAEVMYSKFYRDFLKSDILKVGHHGSNTSTTNEFLKYVQPKISLISAGINNKFNHPSKETLVKLISSKTDIFRTDISGAVILASDGKMFKQINWKNID